MWTNARMMSGTILVCLAACGSAVAQGWDTARPERVGMSSERLNRITESMNGYITRNEVAGTVTLVARKGKVVHFEAQGWRDVEAGEAMKRDAIFRMASMTKPITSVALMMLHEEGHFLLSDPISKWLPEYTALNVALPSDTRYAGEPYVTVPATRPITVQHILTHTAGLANNYRGLTTAEYAKVSQRQSEGETVGDFVSRLASLPLNFEPGTQWEYGRATDLAGRLVEVMSGMTLDAFFQRRIFQPLGMTDTHFFLPESKLDRFTALYMPGDDGKIRLAEAPTDDSVFVREPHVYFMGAGGLVSTVSDYYRFCQMLLNGGEYNGKRLLGRKTVELMTVNHTGDLPIWLTGPGYGFGLGFSILTDRGQAGSMASEGTYGWGGVFCTYFWIDPVEEVIGILAAQVRPYQHLNIRQEFAVLTNQAIID